MRNEIPRQVMLLAEELLTDRQMEVWILEAYGHPQRMIAWQLDISRSSVLDRLDAAHRKLRKAGVRQDLATGNYYLEENHDPANSGNGTR